MQTTAWTLPLTSQPDTWFCIDALITLNGSEQFDDDLTLFLLKQQPASKNLLARTTDGMHKLLMRWMKRKEPRCSTQLPSFPQTANL